MTISPQTAGLSSCQWRIVALKATPGAFEDARLEHWMETIGRPIRSTRAGFALRFRILWPVRFKARKAGFAFFNSLHSFQVFVRAGLKLSPLNR